MQASAQAPINSPVATTSPSSSSVEDLLDTRYLLVMGVLILLVGIMLWVRKRMNSSVKNASTNGGKSWLFNPKTGVSKEVTLLHKRPLDNQNSVVLFEYGDIKYLVMTGNSNVLLEKFQHGEVKDNSDFEKVFEENRRRLDDYLKLQDTKLNTYKNKASADYRTTEY
jgi:flagellar biogenesis protein FliO